MTLTTSAALAPMELALTADQIAHADELHRTSIVIDASAVIYREGMLLPFRWDRYTTGGCTAVNSTVTDPGASFTDSVMQISRELRFIAEHEDRLMLCTTAADIRAAKETGKGGIIFGPQDTSFLEQDLDRVLTFKELGVRIMQLTYQSRNSVGDGCGEPNPGKLSRFGVRVVKEMNDLGLLIDLSHTSHETSFDAIERSEAPVVLTHAHPAGLTPHIRAKSDELLKAVAHSGGVIGVTSLSTFLLRGPGRRPTTKDFIDHVNYLVDLLGPDHVGIGLDLDEVKTEEQELAARDKHPEFAALNNEYNWEDHLVKDLTAPDEIFNVTRALVSAGYEDEVIRKILGKNFLRVFEEVWGS